MADPDNSVLEDARRRARRRLVGAVVLALGAAVVLPMFLESEPKPLGPEVQIQIPPMDDGKFQNRLTPPSARTAPDKAPVAEKPEPASSHAEEGRPPSAAGTGSTVIGERPAPAADTAKSVELAPPNPSTPASNPAATKSLPDSETATGKAPATRDAREATPAPRLQPLPAATMPAAVPATPSKSVAAVAPAVPAAASNPADKAAAEPRGEGEFVVQLGAFLDSTVAKALAEKAGAQGYPAYLEAVTTKSGPVQRVRVGPFATRAAADAAAAKLKTAGFTAVARAR